MKKHVLYIRNCRMMRKMTQKEMADVLGMSQRNYSKIENGEVCITLTRLHKIAGILNVEVEEILGMAKPDFQKPMTDPERELYKQMMNRMEQEIKYLKELMRTLSK